MLNVNVHLDSGSCFYTHAGLKCHVVCLAHDGGSVYLYLRDKTLDRLIAVLTAYRYSKSTDPAPEVNR